MNWNIQLELASSISPAKVRDANFIAQQPKISKSKEYQSSLSLQRVIHATWKKGDRTEIGLLLRRVINPWIRSDRNVVEPQ